MTVASAAGSACGRAAAPRGRLIALEGVDAAGKTTQARLLAESLGAVLTFQFGATDLGAAIRRILLGAAGNEVDERAEALLVVADKAQHFVEVVEPALRAGRDVVSDRFTASTLAYQGYGRGLDFETLSSMMSFATRGVVPDVHVLLEVSPELTIRRLGACLDRFEAAGEGFLEKVRRGYRDMAAREPRRWAVVDGEGAESEVAARVLAAVRDRLGDR